MAQQLFKELQSKMNDINVAMPSKGKSSEPTETLMLNVRREMREDIDISLARDRQQFDRKFDAIQDNLEEMKVSSYVSLLCSYIRHNYRALFTARPTVSSKRLQAVLMTASSTMTSTASGRTW